MWVRIESDLTWNGHPNEGGILVFEKFRVCPCVQTQHRPEGHQVRFVGFGEEVDGIGPAWKWWALVGMEQEVRTKTADMYGLAEKLGWDAGNIGTWQEHRDYAAEFIEGLARQHPLRLVYLKGSDEHRAADLALVELEKRTNSKAAAMRTSRAFDSEMGRVDRFIERMQKRHGSIESDSEAIARSKKKETE